MPLATKLVKLTEFELAFCASLTCFKILFELKLLAEVLVMDCYRRVSLDFAKVGYETNLYYEFLSAPEVGGCAPGCDV